MKKKKTLVTSLAILGVLFITAGFTYAFFTYSRTGRNENSIESGSINFHYQEGSRTLSIQEGMPMPDGTGKTQTEYFDFTITSKTSDSIKVPYYITARRKGNDNSLDGAVKFYLSEVTNKGEQTESETALNLETGNQVDKFSSLSIYTNNTLGITAAKNEKVLYVGEVPANSSSYTKDYRLRMWLSDTAGDITYNQDVTGVCSDSTYTTREDCVAAHKDWIDTATSTQKTFTVTINVYAEGESVVTPSGPNLQGLAKMIYDDNTLITASPTLTTSSNETSDASGLYKMGVTNGFGGANGDSYYFRGNVDNNYVDFAGKTWRVIRINEDGTVRLILDGDTDGADHVFNSNINDFSYMYYSNSQAKTDVETWYNTNITGNNASKVATGNYFCEAAKTKQIDAYTSGSATMAVYSSYTPDLVCNTDGNSKGLLNNSVGLINYDEVVLAGGYYGKSNNSYYLYNNTAYWTMSPAGVNYDYASAWYVRDAGHIYDISVRYIPRLRPVINLKADTLATVDESTGHYVVQ